MTGGKYNRRKRRKKCGYQKNRFSLLNDAVDISAYTATLFVRLNWKIFERIGRATIQVISSVYLTEEKNGKAKCNFHPITCRKGTEMAE
jgi:hypothetical protein